MVVFTCNHCGESLQKPRVEKHYQASTCSRNPIAVSCMDCFKDFKLEEYVAHTKCISEDERYSAKGTVHSVKKGEAKQSSWVQTVNSIIEQQQNAKPSVKGLLEMISKYDNIPRKKVKFVNFVKSSSGGRIASNDIEEVWSLLEAHKNAAKAETAKNDNDKKKRKSDEDTPETNGEDSSAPKKKKKKNKSDEVTNIETAASVAEEDKSSKKKKRKMTETESDEKVETKEPEAVTNNDQPKKKKKKGKINGEEASTEEQVNGNEKVKSEEMTVCSTENEEKPKKKKKNKNNGMQLEKKVAEEIAVNGAATENGTVEGKKKKNKNNTEAETTVTVAETPAVNGTESPKKKKKSKATINENGTVQNGESASQNGTTNNDVDTDKKSKKKNQQKENGENDTTLETNNGEFCWRSAITEVLKSQPKGINKDKLKTKVFEKYTASKGKIDKEGKLSKQYNKKIKKIGNVKLENDVFTWVE